MTNINKHLPRDVFLYLLAIIGLGMVSVNFGTILFQLINIYVPDIVSDRHLRPEFYYGAIRWSISALVIVFPVFIWVTRFLKKDIMRFPEKRELKIRKWLLYLTLFVAGVVVIGDLVALVYSFLQGELTLRFLLKILTVFVIAGSIFYYYLNELRERAIKSLCVFSWAVVVVVLAAIVVGLFVAGLPQDQRLKKFDERRVEDLQVIQNRLVFYWQSKQTLPVTLNELEDDISGFTVPVDPKTEESYEYEVIDSLKFKLCAIFEAESFADYDRDVIYEPRSPASSDGWYVWEHGIGRVCFDRTIDPDLNRPFEKTIR
jgi:hypothetical protein